MSIRAIRTFVQINKLGSFTRAARVLGMTQSTVSLQMKALETKMGVELFDRSNRRPTINARGRSFLKKAVELLAIYDELGETVTRYDELIGTLNIGSVNTIMTGILPNALLALRQQHAGLETRIIGGLSEKLMHQVDNGEIDAALVSEPPLELNANLSWVAICAEPLVVISPKTSAGQSDIWLLQNFPFIRFNRKTWAGQLIDKQLLSRGIEVSDCMSLDSLEAISLMVSSGLGVSIAPQRAIDRPFPTSLNVCAFGDRPIYRNIGMITRANSGSAPLTNALSAALASAVERTAPTNARQ